MENYQATAEAIRSARFWKQASSSSEKRRYRNSAQTFSTRSTIYSCPMPSAI
ncbi:hypothetical protein MCHI_000115 [Candidatus Magnetoovum chiemensis]|nr:hypothetical protein MCHI_000115 [Candidatus Magnetoovum chiemensis]